MVIGAPHADPPGIVTLGQVLEKPTEETGVSASVHALLMLSIFLVSAFRIDDGFAVTQFDRRWRACRRDARPSTCRGLVFGKKKAAVDLPIAI